MSDKKSGKTAKASKGKAKKPMHGVMALNLAVSYTHLDVYKRQSIFTRVRS